MKKRDRTSRREKLKKIRKRFSREYMKAGSDREIAWSKLDNAAHLFPVISNERISNVYRLSAVLSEDIDKALLQRALDIVLPKFDLMNCRLRQGFSWYYFERNGKPSPEVRDEDDYPCVYINQDKNRSYLFRVTYYGPRINLEVFHVLSDGIGGYQFLKELVYQYLRLKMPPLREEYGDDLTKETSLNLDDSYFDNFHEANFKNPYRAKKAYILPGAMYSGEKMGVMHGMMPVSTVKAAAKRYNATINEFLVASLVWAIYKGPLGGYPSKEPISVNVPVNLRPYFDSVTSRNFFIMVAAEFHPKKKDMEFSEIVEGIKENLRPQLEKEHLELILSRNVMAEKYKIISIIPLFFKKIGLRSIYRKNAKNNTTTLTNLGRIDAEKQYEPYIKNFQALLPRSRWQNLKVTVLTYKDALTATFTSVIKDPAVQREFFRHMVSEGIEVEIETNGVYYEQMSKM